MQRYETLIASDGTAALEVLRERGDSISVVLLDLTMPGMSGGETLRRIRQTHRKLPVILSSGYSKEQALSQVDPQDVATFLAEPYRPNDLLDRVSKLLGGCRQVTARR